MNATLPPPSGSPADEALLRHLTEHLDSEQELIESYERLWMDAPEQPRYLIGLILEDELRHHELLRDMANSLKRDIGWTGIESAVPSWVPGGPQKERLLEETTRYLELERRDVSALKDLAKRSRQGRDPGVFSLLIELMRLDTKKHIAILTFIEKSCRPW